MYSGRRETHKPRCRSSCQWDGEKECIQHSICLSGDEDQTAYAHTRGRTVLKPPAPLPDENKISYKVEKVYYGQELLESDIKKAMKKGTVDFKVDCQRWGILQDPSLNRSGICILYSEL